MAQDELDHISENGLKDPMTPNQRNTTAELQKTMAYNTGPYSHHVNIASKKAGIDSLHANREA